MYMIYTHRSYVLLLLWLLLLAFSIFFNYCLPFPTSICHQPSFIPSYPPLRRLFHHNCRCCWNLTRFEIGFCLFKLHVEGGWQSVEGCYGVLRCVAVRCGVLQRVAAYCSQSRVISHHLHPHHYGVPSDTIQHTATHHIAVLQCVAACCSVLQRVAVQVEFHHTICTPTTIKSRPTQYNTL